MAYRYIEAWLKSRELIHLVDVIAPDENWEEHIKPFLEHKPSQYKEHIDKVFAGKGESVTRFYLGLSCTHFEIMGNIMTAEKYGVGHLAHVYVPPKHRKKGVASAILKHLLEDFNSRSGKLLVLGTEYKSVAYHLYTGFGFKDWPNKEGAMYYRGRDWPEFKLDDEYLDEWRFLT